ncbi:DUF3794 domain-containing protein [Clostridium ganghwense]|uniref:DUF3794 domain-containing protein n=1 Tax=Clostridium ganghwense TaxID=312089 RepID=A0ABT4CMS1_9CLOT|nr:DUF3794 domain-containing protein [Clostridium ganghwense]MCY6369536.1 DUF3794 domain-containing protein [Clostridium ganghwense]
MASIVKNLIEYVGIVDPEQLPEQMTSFKQLTVQENLTIPSAKPDIEQIVRVMAEAVITSTKIIETPIGKSKEGQILTGRKIIIEGMLNQKIEYVADEPTQSVHAAHFKVPFSTFIVLPEDFEDGTVVTIIPYIEDIYVKQVTKRDIFKNVTLLLDAIY